MTTVIFGLMMALIIGVYHFHNVSAALLVVGVCALYFLAEIADRPVQNEEEAK